MKYSVKLNDQDALDIERAHFRVDAMASLIERVVTRVSSISNADELLEKYFDEYNKMHKEYSLLKETLEEKYKPQEIADKAVSWEIVFNTKEMIFEVPDATTST